MTCMAIATFFHTHRAIFLSATLLFSTGSIMAQYLLSKPTKNEVRPNKEQNLGFIPFIIHCSSILLSSLTFGKRKVFAGRALAKKKN